MVGVRKVTTTSLFWETLGELRSHRNYAFLRDAIEDLVGRKADSIAPVNGRDKPFTSDANLKGIWHCSISRNPDVVLFYTVEGGTLNLAMLGSHHDYPSDGTNRRSATRTAGRIHNAIAQGHVTVPSWKTLAWSRPSDLVGHRELGEVSAQVLDVIVDELRAEADTGALFKRLHGYDILDGRYEDMEAWFAEVTAASEAVLAARYAKPLSCFQSLEALAAKARTSAFTP